MNKILNFFKKAIIGIIVSILTICISVIATLNLTIIYSYSVDKYNLNTIVNLSKSSLLNDYYNLIYYLQNPFIKDLRFENFPMSVNGEFHFYEVKKIFLSIYLILFIIIVLSMLYIYINKRIGNKVKLSKLLNYGANTLIVILTTLLLSIYIDFSKAFTVFHKIFFNNDYWIFDERTDPIIKVLPEEVFKLYALIILLFIFIAVVSYKVYYLINRSSYVIEKHNDNIKSEG